jgi:hypothetical protein
VGRQRRTAAIALCLALVVCAVFATAASGRVFIHDSTQAYKFKPDRIKIIAGAGTLLRLKDLRPWADWGEVPARAGGQYVYPTCNPDCASGNYESSHAKVRLRHIRSCHGRRVYREVIVRPKRRHVNNAHFRLNCAGYAT